MPPKDSFYARRPSNDPYFPFSKELVEEKVYLALIGFLNEFFLETGTKPPRTSPVKKKEPQEASKIANLLNTKIASLEFPLSSNTKYIHQVESECRRNYQSLQLKAANFRDMLQTRSGENLKAIFTLCNIKDQIFEEIKENLDKITCMHLLVFLYITKKHNPPNQKHIWESVLSASLNHTDPYAKLYALNTIFSDKENDEILRLIHGSSPSVSFGTAEPGWS